MNYARMLNCLAQNQPCKCAISQKLQKYLLHMKSKCHDKSFSTKFQWNWNVTPCTSSSKLFDYNAIAHTSLPKLLDCNMITRMSLLKLPNYNVITHMPSPKFLDYNIAFTNG